MARAAATCRDIFFDEKEPRATTMPSQMTEVKNL